MDELTATLPPGPTVAPVTDDGPLVGRYRLGACIGRGGSGEVLAAEDLLTGERVAVKFVPMLGEHARRQLRRELSALLALRIPGVVRLRDEGTVGTGRSSSPTRRRAPVHRRRRTGLGRVASAGDRAPRRAGAGPPRRRRPSGPEAGERAGGSRRTGGGPRLRAGAGADGRAVDRRPRRGDPAVHGPRAAERPPERRADRSVRRRRDDPRAGHRLAADLARRRLPGCGRRRSRRC